MRNFTILILALTLTACCPKVAPVPTTEAAINLETEQLVRVSLTDRLMQSVEKYYRNQVSPMLIDKGIAKEDAEGIVNSALLPLIEAEQQRLLDALVPLYRRYYTVEEIHQLFSFYQTEVARKSVKVSPQIAAESQEYVRLWNENLGNELMQIIDAGIKGNGEK